MQSFVNDKKNTILCVHVDKYGDKNSKDKEKKYKFIEKMSIRGCAFWFILSLSNPALKITRKIPK